MCACVCVATFVCAQKNKNAYEDTYLHGNYESPNTYMHVYKDPFHDYCGLNVLLNSDPP